jgi:hypothetical protein
MCTSYSSPRCSCEGNWRHINAEVNEATGHLFNSPSGDVFQFFGVMYGADDLYYGMISPTNPLKMHLLSCVGDLLTWGYSPVIKNPSLVKRIDNPKELPCICNDAWSTLLSEYSPLLDSYFTDDSGTPKKLIGLVNGESGLAYALWSKELGLSLISAEDPLTSSGYRLSNGS